MKDIDEVEQVEAWFVSRGIPHFIEGYSATRDVFTRALAPLTFVFVAELGGAVNLDWSWWANVAALVAAGGLGAGAWAGVNRVRGRPAWQRPDRLGAPELAVFVLAPALLPLVFGGQSLAAALTAAGNLALVGAVYLVTSYGLVPMSRWAAGQVVSQLGSLAGLLVRALPLLLLFVTFLFVNAEVWEVSATLDGPYFWVVTGLFAALGVTFLATRLPREVRALVADDGHGTPAQPPLSRRQWGNLGLVLLFNQGLQVLLVSVVIGAFFVVFGLLLVPPETIAGWTGDPVGAGLASFDLWGRRVVLTRELLQVSGFLAAFSGLYFSVYAVTDATYRAEFFEDVTADVREALAVRRAYLAALRVDGSSPCEVGPLPAEPA